MWQIIASSDNELDNDGIRGCEESLFCLQILETASASSRANMSPVYPNHRAILANLHLAAIEKRTCMPEG